MKRTLTMMALLTAMSAAEQGTAQTEITLTTGQQEHISVPESTNIYIDGDVVFEGLSKGAGETGGAAISIGDRVANSEPINVSLRGDDAQRAGNLSFINNFSVADHNMGGAIGSKQIIYSIAVAFENLLSLTFSGNSMDGVRNQEAYVGGGSVGARHVRFNNIRSLLLDGGDDPAKVNAPNGGAILCASLQLQNVDSVKVQNHLTQGGGWASTIGIHGSYGGGEDSYIVDCGIIDISNNRSIAYSGTGYTNGGALLIERSNLHCYGNEKINICRNYTSNEASVLLKTGNYDDEGYFDFYLNGDFTMAENRAGYYPAGIKLMLIPLDVAGRLTMSADYGDITFVGNIGSTERLTLLSRAVSVFVSGESAIEHGTAAEFRAMEGHSVHFYDPIFIRLSSSSEAKVVSVYFNMKPDEQDSRNATMIQNYQEYLGGIPDFTGTIHFSGEYYLDETHTPDSYLQPYAGEDNETFSYRLLLSRWSSVEAQITLGGGELLIENSAVLGTNEGKFNCALVYNESEENGVTTRKTEIAMDPYDSAGNVDSAWRFDLDTALNVVKGALAIRTNGIAIAKNIAFSGHDAILRTDSSSRIIADKVDMSRGVSVDFGDALARGITTGLTITSNSLDMGTTFTLGVPDHTAATPGAYYRDAVWQTDHTFVVFDATRVLDKSKIDDLSSLSIVSVSNGTNVVDYEDGNQGEWRIFWGEDDPYVLYAQWINTAVFGGGGEQPIVVTPEREGMAVENSLWSAKGNAEQLQNAALGQVTLMRFEDHHATRFWSSALGEFERVNKTDGVDGYDYSGAGYAVGGDRTWKNRYLAGVGFGQMFGKNHGRSLPDAIDQDSIMAMVYGAAVQRLSDRDNLIYTGSLTYGWSDQVLHSWQGGTSPTRGSWDAEALLIKAGAQWSHRLSERALVGISLGLEYAHARRDGFTETGDRARRFDRSSLAVLSMPIQASWTYEASLSGTPWAHTLYASYTPDLYREDPRSRAHDDQGYWNVRGVAPGRHGFGVGYSTQWAATESCTIYAGYSYEFRNTASYHNFNAGISVSF